MQTLLPSEIVVSDDASSDETVALVRRTIAECQAHRPSLAVELRVLQNRHALRVTKNFEQAVGACRSDIVALCDQDDIWHLDRLRKMADEFGRRSDLTLLHTDARLVDEEGRALGSTLFEAIEVESFELARIHSGQALDVLLRRNVVTGATTMFRRNLLERALPFPAEWLHDEWLAVIAALTGSMDVLDEQLIDYRQHAKNEVGARRPSLLQNFQRAFAPRGQRRYERLSRAERLLERLPSLGVPKEAFDKVHSKVEHQRFRAALPSWRPARVCPVACQAARGQYRRYDRGLQAVVADIFEAP